MTEVTIYVVEIVSERSDAWFVNTGHGIVWLPKRAIRSGAIYEVGMTGLHMSVDRSTAQHLGII